MQKSEKIFCKKNPNDLHKSSRQQICRQTTENIRIQRMKKINKCFKKL